MLGEINVTMDQILQQCNYGDANKKYYCRKCNIPMVYNNFGRLFICDKCGSMNGIFIEEKVLPEPKPDAELKYHLARDTLLSMQVNCYLNIKTISKQELEDHVSAYSHEYIKHEELQKICDGNKQKVLKVLDHIRGEFARRNVVESAITQMPEQKPEIDGPQLIKKIQYAGMTGYNSSASIVKMIDEGKTQTDYIDKNGNTPLICACDYNRNTIALALIATNKSKPDHIANDGTTALICACRANLNNVALALIDTGLSKPGSQPANSNSALFEACRSGSSDVALAIIKTNQVQLNYTDKHGKTALYFACRSGLADVVTELIKDETVDLVFKNGSTALIEACLMRQNIIAVKLIETGRSTPEALSISGNNTALMIACDWKMPDVALAIIKTGNSNPNNVNSLIHKTALIIACENRIDDVALAIIETGKSKPHHVGTNGEYFLCHPKQYERCSGQVTNIATGIKLKTKVHENDNIITFIYPLPCIN